MLLRSLILALFVVGSSQSLKAQPAARPNILLILADDMGFADAGCYGGEIRTPNLDRLAENGVRFTQFYNTGRCWPTRSALLTGYYPQQIRMDPPRGRLPEWARLLPHHLKPLGYRSYHSGKWHVNGAPRTLADGGFDRSYRLEDHDRNFSPTNLVVDDVRVPPVASGSNYYTTIAFADFMIDCLKEHAEKHSSQPFFGYLAFTAPHFPLQALPEDIARYRDRYLEGWDAIRRERYERQLKMGLVNCALSEREPEEVPHWNLKSAELKEQIGSGEVARAVAWNELTSEEQRFQATKMAIHAAMIDRMDQEIGRVLNQIKAMGALENTIVMFASDNGSSAEFLNRGDKHNQQAELGSAGSFLCLGPGWSTVGNTPFRLHKSWVHEGGISTPLIVQWPAGIRARGELRRAVGHVIDIVPTLLEVVGPQRGQNTTGIEGPPLPGRSLVPAFGNDVNVRREFLYFHHEHNRALRVGDWKLVSKRPNTNEYALYDLSGDRSERVNLAEKEPARVADMARRWQNIETEFRTVAAPAARDVQAVGPPPTDWIEPATGHRVVRLSREPGSASLYFHQHAYSADGRKLVITTPSGISAIDLQTRAIEPVVRGNVRVLVTGRKTGHVYYVREGAVFATDLDTKATREVAKIPAELRDGGNIAVNADETLLVGVARDPEGTTEPRTPPPGRGGGRLEERWAAGIPMVLYTIDTRTGEVRKIYREHDWTNHLQCSPTDPSLVMFCHEGPWHYVDRIWTIRTDGSGLDLMHKRALVMEIAGHEFFSADGRTIWYDLQTPKSGVFWLAGVDIQTGARTWYHLERKEWSVHFNISPDGTLFAGDGGGPSSVANRSMSSKVLQPPGNGQWIYLFRPVLVQNPASVFPAQRDLIKVGYLDSERLVDLSKHNYRLEPNVTFTPDGKWIVFRSNMHGATHVYAVEVKRAQPAIAPIESSPSAAGTLPQTLPGTLSSMRESGKGS